MKIISCEQCGSEMILEKRLNNTKKKKGAPKGYRVRRFICSCGHRETIFADGVRDKLAEPHLSKYEVDKMYKEQAEYNN